MTEVALVGVCLFALAAVHRALSYYLSAVEKAARLLIVELLCADTVQMSVFI